MDGVLAVNSRGSQKLLWLVLDCGWKVSPLRSDMFWKESIREGARLGSFAAGLGAARRRGCWAAGVDI